MNDPRDEYISRLEEDGYRKVRAFAEIIHCVTSAQASGLPIDGDRIVMLAQSGAPFASKRQPTNPATLVSMGAIDA